MIVKSAEGYRGGRNPTDRGAERNVAHLTKKMKTSNTFVQ